MRHWLTPMSVLTKDGNPAAAIRYGDRVWVLTADGRGGRHGPVQGWEIEEASPWVSDARTYTRDELLAMLPDDGQAAGDETVPLEDWVAGAQRLQRWQRLLDTRVREVAIVPVTGTGYRVTWEFDVETDSAIVAAVEAWKAMRREGSIANVFTVTAPDGRRWRVDLTENEVEEVDREAR